MVIDETHHFRNPGITGTGAIFLEAPKAVQQPTLFSHAKRSKYRGAFDQAHRPAEVRAIAPRAFGLGRRMCIY